MPAARLLPSGSPMARRRPWRAIFSLAAACGGTCSAAGRRWDAAIPWPACVRPRRLRSTICTSGRPMFLTCWSRPLATVCRKTRENVPCRWPNWPSGLARSAATVARPSPAAWLPRHGLALRGCDRSERKAKKAAHPHRFTAAALAVLAAVAVAWPIWVAHNKPRTNADIARHAEPAGGKPQDRHTNGHCRAKDAARTLSSTDRRHGGHSGRLFRCDRSAAPTANMP